MGCVVNGPGEARGADVGIAGGKGEGLVFRKGEIIARCRKQTWYQNYSKKSMQYWRNARMRASNLYAPT